MYREEIEDAGKSRYFIHMDYEERWLINTTTKDGARYGKINCSERNEENDDGTLSDKTFCNPDFIQMVMHQTGHILNLGHSNKEKSIMAEKVVIPDENDGGKNYALDQTDGSDIFLIRQSQGIFIIPS